MRPMSLRRLYKYSQTPSAATSLQVQVLDELEIESCVYVGASVSGMVRCLASIERPEVFRKLVLLESSPRYLNDVGYYGGFNQADLDQLYGDIKSNFKSWVTGFGPKLTGARLQGGVLVALIMALVER